MAAHISAASKGGPRYDESLTPAARRSAANGIWLCNSCSRLIDSDVDGHPTELLHEWKRLALSEAASRLGRPILNSRRVEQQIASIFRAVPSPQSTAAVQNAHRAAKQYLEGLDGRINVETAFADGTPSYHLHANEDVTLELSIESDQPEEFIKQWKGLQEDGRAAVLPVSGLRVTGSPLFEELTSASEPATLSIEPIDQQATLRLFVAARDSREVRELGAAEGAFTHGSKRATFRADFWGGVLSVSLFQPLTPESGENCQLNIGTSFKAWQGRDIRALPHATALLLFIEELASGQQLGLDVFVGSSKVLRHRLPSQGQERLVRSLKTSLRYLARAAYLAEVYDLAIQFDERFKFHDEDYALLGLIERVLTGKLDTVRSEGPPVICTTIFDKTTNFEDMTTPLAVRFVARPPSELPLFGHLLSVPALVAEVQGVPNSEPATMPAGVAVDLVFDPKHSPVSMRFYFADMDPKLLPAMTPLPEVPASGDGAAGATAGKAHDPALFRQRLD